MIIVHFILVWFLFGAGYAFGYLAGTEKRDAK